MLKGELFNTDMVRAYLDGRKIHTARPIATLPPNVEFRGLYWDEAGKKIRGVFEDADGFSTYVKPTFLPGNFMYCRETWRMYQKAVGNGENFRVNDFYAYKADENRPEVQKSCEWYDNLKPLGFGSYKYYKTGSWRPSLHMPREAARLFFQVTKVGVMRIEDVSEQFAQDDGFLNDYTSGRPENPLGEFPTAAQKFKNFWLGTYGPSARWMWVYWTEPCSREQAERGIE